MAVIGTRNQERCGTATLVQAASSLSSIESRIVITGQHCKMCSDLCFPQKPDNAGCLLHPCSTSLQCSTLARTVSNSEMGHSIPSYHFII